MAELSLSKGQALRGEKASESTGAVGGGRLAGVRWRGVLGALRGPG